MINGSRTYRPPSLFWGPVRIEPEAAGLRQHLATVFEPDSSESLLVVGDTRRALGHMPDCAFQCCVTSQRASLPEFCKAMCSSLADLVRQLSPTVTPRDVQELPLLTLGSIFQGANNVLIGKQATADVFLSIREIVRQFVVNGESQKLVIENAAGRRVTLVLGSDPDIRIEEDFSGTPRKKVAIEIKGGTDKSNAHNRAGEAEKSHQKAKREGFRDFWTIIAKKGLDIEKLRSESPTTTSWFDVAHVLGREGKD